MALDHPSAVMPLFTVSRYIDEGLWFEILKRITNIKTLGRFRCVCKSWKSIISSRRFAGEHAAIAAAGASFAGKSYILCDLFNHVMRFDQFAVYDHQQMKFQHFPFINISCYFIIVDVVGGIVFLLSDNFSLLWSPVARKYVCFRAYEPPMNVHNTKFGFGLDSLKNNLKVVRIVTSFLASPICEVYSIEDHLWRKVQFPNDTVILSCLYDHGFFMNGCIHWIMKTKSVPESYALLLFDCDLEELRMMDPPEELKNPEFYGILRLSKHFGMLSLLRYGVSDEIISMWVMEEYGVASSWKKILSIDHREFRNNRGYLMFNEDSILFLDCVVGFPFITSFHGLVLEENMFFTGIESSSWSYGKEEVIYIT